MKTDEGKRQKGQGIKRRRSWDLAVPLHRVAALAIAFERARQWALADRMKIRMTAALGGRITHDERDSLRQCGRQARECWSDLVSAVNAGGVQ